MTSLCTYHIDTYSGFIYASAHSSEATKHVIAHCLATFTIMGKPHQIKMIMGLGTHKLLFTSFANHTRYSILLSFHIIHWDKPF
jgi:hypothetical protein